MQVLRTFPMDKSNCPVQTIMERSHISNKVYLQYFLCKLNAWGYINEHGDTYALADKGVELLKN